MGGAAGAIAIRGNDLEIRLIGAFALRSAKGDHTPAKRKAAAILAYLILSGQSRETRGRLAALLWSESDEERARASLRQCIRDLRRVEIESGAEFLLVDKLAVGMRPGTFRTDVTDLDQLLVDAVYETASRMLVNAKEGLCLGLYDCDPVFDNWLRMQSTAWLDRTVGRLAALLETAGAHDRKAIATCILQLDPFFEPAVEEMLRVLHREGGYARAHAYFERYAEELREELDLGPSARIAREVAALKKAAASASVEPTADKGAAAAPRLGAAREPVRPTIAIVTVRQFSDDAHIQFALASELSASLSRFRHWTAIQAELDSPGSKGVRPDAVRAVVNESVDLIVLIEMKDERGRRVFQITCHDFAQGEPHFSMTALPDSSSWKSASNELCAQISARLQIAISTTRLHRIKEASPNQISAYDAWLQGQQLARLWNKEAEIALVERFEEAIRLDPQLSCGYSSLAAALNSRWIVWPGLPNVEDDFRRAFDLAKKAALLDPFDHRNQVNLAWSHLLARRWDLAEFHFGLAHDLNASNPETLIAYALASSYLGEHDRAMELSRRAFQLNPLHDPPYHGYQATIAFLAGDLQGCVDAVHRSRNLFPDIVGWSAAANALMGRDREAAADFRLFLETMAEAWHDGTRPRPRAAIDWFKTIFPIRLAADRQRLAAGIDRAELVSRERAGATSPAA